MKADCEVENETIRYLSLDELEEVVCSEHDMVDTVFRVHMSGHEMPLAIKVISRPVGGVVGKPLVICLHGAVDPNKRSLPVFDGEYLRKSSLANALVISISDPLLERHRTLKTTWYAGSEYLDTPGLLLDFVNGIQRLFQPGRMIFSSTSTGGHAALRLAWHVPGSVVVVSNPIVKISSYFKEIVGEYRRSCWPSVGDGDPWPDTFMDNVASLYKTKIDCNVVYLNNARDHHVWMQAIPFLYAVRGGDSKRRLMFISSYYPDYGGHSTHPKIFARWVVAACEAKSPSVLDIAARAEELAAKDEAMMKVPALSDSDRHASIPQGDLDIARKILASAE